eukprot:10053341-Heterocapsa_arctica.AAC.1
MLAGTLFNNMEGSKPLEVDLARYNRQVEGHTDKTYKYLLNIMERNISLQQQKANREADSKAIRSGNMGLKGAPAINGEGLSKNAIKKAAREAKLALAAPPGGKGAGKGKGKPPKEPCGGAGTGSRPSTGICWYHNHGGCTKSAEN